MSKQVEQAEKHVVEAPGPVEATPTAVTTKISVLGMILAMTGIWWHGFVVSGTRVGIAVVAVLLVFACMKAALEDQDERAVGNEAISQINAEYQADLIIEDSEVDLWVPTQGRVRAAKKAAALEEVVSPEFRAVYGNHANRIAAAITRRR